MRIADRMRYEMFKTNIGTLKEKIDKNQAMIASGKKILAPSDDPVIAARSIELGAEKNMNAQYKRNLGKLQMAGAYYETSVNTIHDLLTRVKELAVSSASDNTDAAGRKTAAEEVDQIIKQLVTVGNTKVAGTYIFGGKKSDAAPFSVVGDNVEWSGTDDVSKVAVGTSSWLEAGISGKAIFGQGADDAHCRIFEVLRQFQSDLNSNDRDAVSADIGDIDDAVDLTANNLSYIGTYTRTIESLLQTNELKDTILTTTESSMVDADVVQLISDLNTLSTAYQSLLYSMSKIQDLSIANYLR